MRSTRRIDRLGPLLAGLFGVLTLGWVVWLAPAAPTAPRYRGAGHDTPERGGTFVFHHETNIRTLDPGVAYDELSGMAIRLLFDGLLEYDTDANLVPGLAVEMPERSPDGKIFRFRLRRGVRFHNGRELVAEDVRWSIERVLRPATASPGQVFFTQLEGFEDMRDHDAEHASGIRVIDDYTIEFQLKEPDQTFLNAIAMPFAYPLPREHYEDPNVDPKLEPCGTSPFTLDPNDWERGVRMILRRNPDYWNQPEPWVDEMVYLENLTRDVALMRFRNGDIDHVHHISPADYLFLRTAPAWAPFREQYPKVNIWGIAMNTQMAPFDNVHVRRAVAFAVDRAGWSRARANRLLVTGQPIPRQLMGYDAHLPGAHVTDLEKAREEMALAGYPVRREGDRFVAEGFPDDIEYWTGEGDTGKQYGELAQADLAQIGIHIRLKAVSFATWLEDTGRPNRARIFLNGWNMDFPDPSNFLDVLFHSRSIAEQNSTNRTFYSNPELDAVLDAAKIEGDQARRSELYQQASRILVADAPWAFMWSDLVMEAWQPYVRGYRPNPVFSNDYRHVWLDLPKQRFSARRARTFANITLALTHPGRLVRAHRGGPR